MNPLAASASLQCPIHKIPLKMEVRTYGKAESYLFCRLAATEGTDCPNMTLAEWRRQQTIAQEEEAKKILTPLVAVDSPRSPSSSPSTEQETDPSREVVQALETADSELGASESMGSFTLPSTPAGLTQDPRTGLDLVAIPPEFARAMDLYFAGDSLLHFVGLVEKINRKQGFDRRILAISSYCMYVLHPSGDLARAFQVTDIERIWISNAAGDNLLFACLIPAEFDLVLRTPHGKTIYEMLCKIYRWKKGKELSITELTGDLIMERTCLDKPKYWKPQMMYVHSRAQLYRRLQQHNEGDASLEYLRMDVDPRTGLELITMPKPSQHLFATGMFCLQREPLLHFFSPCEALTHKGASEKRFCIISNSCLYLCNRHAKLERCIAISGVGRILKEGSSFAVIMQPTEHDLILVFKEEAFAAQAEAVCQAIYQLKRGQELPSGDRVDAATCSLKPTKGWKAEYRSVLTRKDLVAYLAKEGIRPGASVNLAADGLEPN